MDPFIRPGNQDNTSFHCLQLMPQPPSGSTIAAVTGSDSRLRSRTTIHATRAGYLLACLQCDFGYSADCEQLGKKKEKCPVKCYCTKPFILVVFSSRNQYLTASPWRSLSAYLYNLEFCFNWEDQSQLGHSGEMLYSAG